ncbi:MAG: ISAzo13 family transposase, partial [Planctomycetaceae bacterium]|nr:ISAzo13 family transposase [Planctomycetaceae bacterium]
MTDEIISKIFECYNSIFPYLDERGRRMWIATEARSLGRGGINALHKITGVSRKTIRLGIKKLDNPIELPRGYCRQPGGGRKKITVTDQQLLSALNNLIDPTTRGDPESPLRWTCKSLRQLANELQAQGHKVGITTIRKLLKQQGYSLQANSKTREGINHPDRNEQFEYIYKQVKQHIARKQSVISVDTKKKENLGNYSNKGREYQPKKHPVETNMHDFPNPELGKAIPYGVYDIINNNGCVNIGVNHDTAEFAVNSIRTWWITMGCERFPKSKRLLITADAGDSNSYRSRLWKRELQKLSNEFDLEITVCHFPPGTSKWNKVEHRLFSFITKNWRGRPLCDLTTVVNLISNTTTKNGLKIKCVIDEKKYKKGIIVNNIELEKLNITPHKF